MDLDGLLHPVGRDEFLAGYWERRPLHLSRGEPAYYEDLCSRLSLSDVIWQTCRSWGDLSLARAATDHAGSAHGTREPSSLAATRAFRDGYTIVVNNLEDKDPLVGQLCRAVERELLCAANINLYATPAGTQGLDPHYDDQDVFVLQIEGAKGWNLYDAGPTLPLDDVAYEPVDVEGADAHQVVLSPGDLLYLPRGVVHEARTFDERSVHLTLSVSVLRWVTLAQRILHVRARTDPRWRRAVPSSVLRGDLRSEEIPAWLFEDLQVSSAEIELAVGEVQDGVLAGRRRLPPAGLLDEPEASLDAQAVVQRAPDQICILAPSASGLVLKFIGASIEVDDDLAEPIRHLCSGQPCRIDAIPGDLTPVEKVGLVSSLLDLDLLVRCAQ